MQIVCDLQIIPHFRNISSESYVNNNQYSAALRHFFTKPMVWLIALSKNLRQWKGLLMSLGTFIHSFTGHVIEKQDISESTDANARMEKTGGKSSHCLFSFLHWQNHLSRIGYGENAMRSYWVCVYSWKHAQIWTHWVWQSTCPQGSSSAPDQSTFQCLSLNTSKNWQGRQLEEAPKWATPL